MVSIGIFLFYFDGVMQKLLNNLSFFGIIKKISLNQSEWLYFGLH